MIRSPEVDAIALDSGQALCHLGVAALQAGRSEDAQEPLEESLRIAHELQ